MKKHILLSLLVMAVGAKRADAVPEQIGLTAHVVDAGTPITGAHTFTVRIFDAATGGTQQWTENDAATANDGTVYLTLGDQTALDAAVLDGGPLWIELQVDSTVLAPRLEITSSAYAVRAGVAENAELLGGMPSTAFAAANHNHNGTYLPVGPTLSCTGTQKVTGLGTNGSVVCGADVDTSVALAGNGTATTAAHSDHNHNGSYLPVGATLSCTGTQKVTGLNANGSVVCGTDVDRTYFAGTGLTLNTMDQFVVNFGGSGTSNTVARSDHGHAETSCPTGYTPFVRTTLEVGSVICLRNVVASANWVQATRGCVVDGTSLCTIEQVVQARGISSFQITNSRWLADRAGQNRAMRTNVTGNTDFFEIDDDVTFSMSGYYCCLERRWW